MMQQAPQRKTNLFKNKAKTNETNDKKTRFPAAKINPIDKTPKTKKKPPKTTPVHGKTTKTKQNFPCQTNQIGNRTNQMTRKNTMESIKKKLTLQFGFVANCSHSSHHNASYILANTPTWYYFSRPSHLAFHDFTKKHKPQKNLCSLLGLGLKFIPSPTLTNSWT